MTRRVGLIDTILIGASLLGLAAVGFVFDVPRHVLVLLPWSSLDANGPVAAGTTDDTAAATSKGVQRTDMALRSPPAAAPNPAEAIEPSLEAEQVHSAKLQSDLNAARDEIARVTSETDAVRRKSDAAVTSATAQATDRQAKLDALAAQFEAAQQEDTSRTEALQEQVDAEHARAAGFAQDLDDARRRADDAVAATSDAQAPRAALDVADKARQDAEERAGAAEASRDANDRRAADEAKSLQASLEAERTRSAGLVKELDEAGLRIVAMQKASAELEAAGKRAAMAEAQQTAPEAETLRAEVAAEQARADALAKDLDASREQVAEARRAAENAGALQARSEGDRTAANADVQRAAVQLETLQAQYDAEHARAAQIDKELQEQRGTAAAEAQARAALDEARRAADKGRQEMATRAADAASQLDALRATAIAARESAAGQIGALRVQLAVEQARSADLDRELARHAAVSPAATQPIPDKSVTGDAAAEVAPSVSAAAVAGGAALPTAADQRVVIRFASDNDAAYQRALALKRTLEAQGLAVNDPIGGAATNWTAAINYFYGEDREAAARIASQMRAGPPHRMVLPKKLPLPRPGTIEVAVPG